MQEKVVLEVIPGIPQVDDPEDVNFEECKLKVFSDVHRDEIFKIVSELPSTSNSDASFEFPYQRFMTVLDFYQEQPGLLDCCINDMVSKLLSYVTLLDADHTGFDGQSLAAFKLLSHLSKVRGNKSFLAILPHEVFFLEKVLYSLEQQPDDFHASYVLLLWMVILCKNPFNLNRLDPRANDPLYIDRRIVRVAMFFLSRPLDKCHPVAALLLAIVACRAEACSALLPSLVKNSADIVKSCEAKLSNNTELVGNLYLLVAVFKQGRREDLIHLAPLVLESLDSLRHLVGCDFVVKKLVTKLVQRLGMVFLKPKVATWRYDRGNRVLSFNQVSTEDNLRMDTDDDGNDLDYDIPQNQLEIVLDAVLKSLRDCDTGVRWSGAKGVGRVASRLPRNLAEDVVRSILMCCFDDLAGHAAWHGGCLAIAELARRGYLTVELLPDVIEVLKKALIYEESQGRHALGANVRDAACYIAWALARAFRPCDMANFVDDLAACLVCVALFDREINVRRAASAAFQENVGRQGTFPNGIDILTKIDYFAVGQRSRAYVEIACEIAKYDRYSWPIVGHLLHKKITHWDENLRFLAAEALRRLASVCGHLIVDQISTVIVPLLTHQYPTQRQGGILALSGVLSGLNACGIYLERSLLEHVAQIPLETYAVCEKKGRATGGALIRRAVNTFIQLLSAVIPFDLIPVDPWLRSIELNAIDESDSLRQATANAAACFFELFKENSAATYLALRVKNIYAQKLLYADAEHHRQGLAKLLGALPASVLTLTDDVNIFLYETVINALITAIERKSPVDLLWAFGRQDCVEAMTRIALAVDVNSLSNFGRFIDCITSSLNDYTISRQGDVGRFLRECAMRSLAAILPKLQDNCVKRKYVDDAVCKIVQQSCEKIDAVRVCAADVMCELLCGELKDIVEKETLCAVYMHDVPSGFIGDPTPYKYCDWRLKSCFSRLAVLLTSPHYAYPSLCGFVISAGGLTESTRRNAAEAVFAVVAEFRDSKQFMEEFLHNLCLMLVESSNDRRVVLPFLCFLDQMFTTQLLTIFESDPDSSPSLTKIVNFVTRTASNDNNSQSVRLAVTVLCHVLHFSCSSHLWQKATSVIVRTLCSSYPLLRRNAAEQLYECLAAECVDDNEMGRREELLDLLANTKWLTEEKRSVFSEISHSVAHLLNVP